jgi:hypothetical protein
MISNTSNVLTLSYPYDIGSNLKLLCDDVHAAIDIVAERIDDHFLQAELVQFGHQCRQIAIDLRKALFRLDAPDELRAEGRVEARPWDTALTNRDRFAMLTDVETRMKSLLESLRAALADWLPKALEETVQAHYLEVKGMARQLRVMREMVNPY